MGVTHLVWLENGSGHSNEKVAVFNVENEGTRGHGELVVPREGIPIDMWIPWARSAEEFRDHHLRVEVKGEPSYWIWQAARDDGDYVRFSRDGNWHDPGDRVDGASEVDGRRKLIVQGFFGITLERVQSG